MSDLLILLCQQLQGVIAQAGDVCATLCVRDMTAVVAICFAGDTLQIRCFGFVRLVKCEAYKWQITPGKIFLWFEDCNVGLLPNFLHLIKMRCIIQATDRWDIVGIT